MPTKLGQNFLQDKEIIKKIIASSDLKEDDFVIEIGPGEGALTEQLSKYAKKVIAIELDDKLIPLLEKKFSDTKKIEIIHEDILKINLPELLGHFVSKEKNYKVIANIPYYITSPIIRLFLEQDIQPEEIILMVQKEVAERIIARPGETSILSVSVQYYASAELLFEVGRDSFSPAPKVDSAVIKIVPRRKFDKEADKKFFRIVRSGFSAKRKTLLNNLSASLRMEKSSVEEKLKTAGIGPTVRAQELSLENWKKLASLFQK